jgi:hypothetical protein
MGDVVQFPFHRIRDISWRAEARNQILGKAFTWPERPGPARPVPIPLLPKKPKAELHEPGSPDGAA